MKRNQSHILKVFTVVLVLIVKDIAEADQNVTKKCEDGWQGKNCEFCGGKIR